MDSYKDEIFSIVFDTTRDPELIFGEKIVRGQITVGDFKEDINIPIEAWSIEDYLAQWNEGLKRFLDGAKCSCIVTQMRDPVTGTFINTWPIYSEDDIAIFQNRILLCKEIRDQFTGSNFYDFILPHKTTSSVDGEIMPISEWKVSRKSIEEFYAKIQQLRH